MLYSYYKVSNNMVNNDNIKLVPSVLVVKACESEGAIVTNEELQLQEGKSIAELIQDEEKETKEGNPSY